MAKQVLVISASPHSGGETAKAVAALIDGTDAAHIDLMDYKISHYDYGHANAVDDFVAVSARMLTATDIVFATPVYWYAMSGPMKVFFDRLSDLITIRKDEGRALKGRRVWLLANGAEAELPEGFTVPFRRTAEYFDMDYKGHHYLYTHKDDALKQQTWSALNAFKQDIFCA